MISHENNSFVNCFRSALSISGLVYVHQREFALSHPGDPNARYLGSEEATTCHVVVIREPQSGATVLAHLDCGNSTHLRKVTESVVELARRLLDIDAPRTIVGPENKAKLFEPAKSEKLTFSPTLEVSMVGGYDDEDQVSQEITFKLLADMILSQSFIYSLVLPVVGPLNTELRKSSGLHEGHNAPVHYGCAVDLRSGEVIRAVHSFKGPMEILRHARLGFAVDCEDKHRVTEGLLKAYDCATGCVSIPAFNFGRVPGLSTMVDAPAEFILQHMSTSPKVEPASFVGTFKDTAKLVLSCPNARSTLFKGKACMTYRRRKVNRSDEGSDMGDAVGEWEEVVSDEDEDEAVSWQAEIGYSW